MSETWHYEQNQQAKGPVSFEELQQLYSSGQITARDRVWTERLRNWMPAGQVPELAGAIPPTASHPMVAPNVGTLSYSQPQIEQLMFTPRALELLVQTRPWARTISIVMWIFAALSLLGAIGFSVILLAFSAHGGSPLAAIFVGLYCIGLAVMFVPAAIFLGRFASRITDLQRLGRADALEATLEAQKSFWKYIGIACCIVIGLYILLMILSTLFGTMFS